MFTSSETVQCSGLQDIERFTIRPSHSGFDPRVRLYDPGKVLHCRAVIVGVRNLDRIEPCIFRVELNFSTLKIKTIEKRNTSVGGKPRSPKNLSRDSFPSTATSQQTNVGNVQTMNFENSTLSLTSKGPCAHMAHRRRHCCYPHIHTMPQSSALSCVPKQTTRRHRSRLILARYGQNIFHH